MCNYPHVMLHPPAKFRRNRTNIGGLLTTDVISIFQDGGHRVGNLLLSSGLVTAFVQNGENLCAYICACVNWEEISQSIVEIKLLPV